MKYKKTITIALSILAIIVLIRIWSPDIWEKNQSLLKEGIFSINEDAQTINLLELAPFEWDTIYSFDPYTSKDEIYKTVGYKWDRISETVSEEMNQIVFMNDSKVVCYLYGYPENNGYGLYFPSIVEVDDDLDFKVSREDGVVHIVSEDINVVENEKPETLDEVISLVFQEDNKNNYYNGECVGEGHIILGQEKKGKIIIVYALTMYGEYGFEDNNFVKVSGSGAIPAVLFFTESEKGYVLKDIEYAKDGSEYLVSIKELFPFKYQGRVISPTEKDMKDLETQERLYAKKYLEEIGREAIIGNYGDFEHTILTDVGVSVEVSNKTCEKEYGDFPMWIGNHERIEGGTRYVYEMDYHEDSHQIKFIKYEYHTKTIVEKIIMDSITGLEIEN